MSRDACDYVPANIPEVITVGATYLDNQTDHKALFSNHGTCIDLFAPGVDIPSADATSDTASTTNFGTSISAAHVSGAAALILAAHPTYSPAEVAEAIVGMAERDKIQGHLVGAPNRLLRVDAPLPDAPTNLTATAAPDGTIALSWQPVSAPGVHYLVSQRDVTAGQKWFRWTKAVRTGTTATATDLEPGHVYEFTVAAANTMAVSPESNVASATAVMLPPGPPIGLTAAPNSDGTITLAWTAPEPDAWYWVYQRDAGENQPWQQLPLPITTCCTMTAGYLANGHNYEFRVTATRSGVESLPSNVAGVRPLPPRPTAPTNLRATPQDSGEIKLTWDALPIDVYYWVYFRNVSKNGAFTKSELPTDRTEATIGLLTNGDLYEFKVTADNLAGEGPASAPVQARSQVALPRAPTNLYAVANRNLEIHLNWDAPGPNMFYWVYWREDVAGRPFVRSALPTDKTNATIGMLTHGQRYEFKVTAENLAGEGPASTPVTATATGTAPDPPSGLSATPGDGSVRLNWPRSPSPNVGYFVYYRNASDGQSWQRMPFPVMDCCTHTVSMLTNGDLYEFKVTAGNAAGESPASNVASVRPLPPFPQPPSNLRATAGDGKVTLAWTASPTPGVFYWIEYRVAGGTWHRLKYPVSTCCTFVVGLLANGTTYEFRVRATNVAGDSAPSNVDSARPLPPFPQPPGNLRATAGDGKVTLAWNASPTANVWYVVDYRKAGGSWQRMPYPVTTCCGLTVRYLLNGTTYEFRVRATNLAGESSATNVASARPMPPFPQRPTNLRATTGSGTGQVKLTWSASPTPGVYYYVYQRNYTLSGFWQRLPYPVSGTSMTAGLLAPGHTYQFKITAINLSGESSPSNIASAVPRYANGTTRYDEVTSSWILGELGNVNPVQRYDITGWVRGTRDGFHLRLDGGWRVNNGKQLLVGAFYFNIVDCVEGYPVETRYMPYEGPTSDTSESITFVHFMNPRNTYKVTINGGGNVSYTAHIHGRFSLYPDRGIIPFVAETSCF